jgi:transposase
MNWQRMLAYITGTVDQELLLRNEYLVTENRVLRGQIKGRLRFSDPERRSLAEIAKRLGRNPLEEIATVVTPETLLSWHRKLIARKFDGSKHRRPPGRPRTSKEVEELVLRFARENRSWGQDRIAGALANIGVNVSDRTVGAILTRHGLEPAPARKKGTTWKEFIRSHMNVLTATDFFTAEVWTPRGLVTFYCLFFIRMATREVHLAGITPYPEESWMKQVARNLTMTGCGFLSNCGYLIHDRDTKFCEAFREILGSAGVKTLALPAHSPNLNAFSERFVRTAKEEGVERLILFGERSLRHVLENFIAHYHQERNHQGLENRIPFPAPGSNIGSQIGPIHCHERLGGLLKFYSRRAA